MSEKRAGRVYWRTNSKGQKRAFGDFRDYSDVGGKRKALIPPGARTPTTDEDVAMKLVVKRVKELEALRRDKELIGVTRKVGLESYAAEHLLKKKKAGKVRDRTLMESEFHLQRAVEFFGADTDIAAIKPGRVAEWSAELQQTLSNSTVSHHLSALSNMYRRALSEDLVTRNPVSDMMDKPEPAAAEAEWLEVSEAALLLEAARVHKGHHTANPFTYELIGTMLLTGGRMSEVFGLEVDDISLTRKTVTFRPNSWRLLKTKKADRVVPLWPQLEEILRAYLLRREREAPLGRLLFPSPKSTPEREMMLDNMRKIPDTVAVSAGWEKGEITTKWFRHTYCAARLQNLDRGQPVAVWTVSRELGHASTDRVENVYGHLGDVRHRSEVVEYRVEQHREALAKKLDTLEAGAHLAR